MNLVIQADIKQKGSVGDMFRRHENLYNLSKEDFNKYAESWGAKYELIEELHPEIGNAHPTYLRYLPILDESYDKYEFILYADCDVLINTYKYNIFEDTQDEFLYAVSVIGGLASIEADRFKNIMIQCNALNLDSNFYFNAGISLMGRNFRKKVRDVWGEYKSLWSIEPNPIYTDQTVMNKIAQDHNLIKLLDPRWNFLQKGNNGNHSRSWFVHLLDKNLEKYLKNKPS